MANIPEFRPDLDADQVHIALKKSVEILDQVQHCALLWFGEIMRRKLYRDLGFSSMRTYAMEALGFSPTRAGDFIRLARRLESLPIVKKEVATGKLGYTKARVITTVADPTNELEWLKVAKEKSRRELEATVRQAKKLATQQRKENPDQGELIPRPASIAPPAGVPVRVGFELTPAQYARYEAMLAKIGHRGSKADLLLDMVEALLVTDENAPGGRLPIPTIRFTSMNVRPAPKPPFKPPKAKWSSPKPRLRSPGKMLKSTLPVSATKPLFLPVFVVKSWPAIVTAAVARVATTPDSWKSTISSHAQPAAPTTLKIWSLCAPPAMNCGTFSNSGIVKGFNRTAI